MSEGVKQNPLRDYSLVSVPYGEFREDYTDDELIVERVQDGSVSDEDNLDYEEKLALGLKLEKNGLDGSMRSMEESHLHRYSFSSGEIYTVSHEDALVLVGDEELLREKVFQEYLKPLEKS